MVAEVVEVERASLPTRERELKPGDAGGGEGIKQVAPYTGA